MPVRFLCFAKSKSGMYALFAIAICLCLINFGLSMSQVTPVNDSDFSGWKDNICENKVVVHLSPFQFSYDGNGDTQLRAKHKLFFCQKRKCPPLRCVAFAPKNAYSRALFPLFFCAKSCVLLFFFPLYAHGHNLTPF